MPEKELLELWLTERTNLHSEKLSPGKFFIDSVLKRYKPRFDLSHLTKNEHGKPELPHSDLQFNLSHCDEDFALVICRNGDCGVDIQKVGKREKFDEAFLSVFTDREYSWLDRRGDESLFFKLWSVKEAFIKARGGSIWYGRDFHLLPEEGISERKWFSNNQTYFYTMKTIGGKYLSLALTSEPGSLEIHNFP